ncbi:cupredoxin domain-containing protein [Blastococcus sp. TML/M2B]|uniref:cupredoxin domain-containing protein n=1 Tax=unclassified Blastococcus TaxID=2619396 RepID=UPI00190B338E|nr:MULTISPECIES: cupredoxin domain-containing protein [unclassified Blastococcus]MBN1091369.1 cupredoxin domain-containing protein [Blastococcus sp. TML/M2B]MBN1095076.1 cupredoxin domain-containing protein [Blastococcus sp. TML/C7B]
MRAGARRRTAALCAGAVLAVGALTGCGGDDGGDGGGGDGTSASTEVLGVVTIAEDGVQEVTIRTQDDYVFTPDTFTVAPGKVRLTVVNAADEMTHNLKFDEGEGPEPIGAGIDFLAPGQELTIDFEVAVPGDHPFTCTFHTQLGQVGTMTVSQGG